MTAEDTRDAPVAPAARLVSLLGPAFVAAIAYVDPGNVAVNLTAGARFGASLVWVLVLANATAVVVQYLSAKLGLVTGRSLPELLGDRLARPWRIGFWIQAELAAAATDVAEVIGGAIALELLFRLPLVIGGLVVGAVSMVLLLVQSRGGQRPFEAVIVGLLAVITIGFVAGLFVRPVPWGTIAAGLVPHFAGPGALVLATGMLGATVMPHAVYLHSALSRDRHGEAVRSGGIVHLLRATRLDVVASLALAGTVNIAMLVLAAVDLGGSGRVGTIEGAHAAIVASLGPVIGVAFGLGLLASGLASTSVGVYAGTAIMSGLLKRRIPLVVRRVVVLIPALVVLGVGAQPTAALVLSQVVLSIALPFALVPLVRLTNDRDLMGEQANGPALRVIARVVVVAVVLLNVALIALTTAGVS